MFTTELKRLKSMIVEVVWPTCSDNDKRLPANHSFGKNGRTFTLRYDDAKKSFVAFTKYLFSDRYDPDKGDEIEFQIEIWTTKSGMDMESIDVYMDACYLPWKTKKKGEDYHLSRTDHIVPDARFLEYMDMNHLDAVAMTILKQSRTLLRSLNERISPCKEQ